MDPELYKKLGSSRPVRDRRNWIFSQIMEVNPYLKTTELCDAYTGKFKVCERTFYNDLKAVYILLAELTLPSLSMRLNIAVNTLKHELEKIEKDEKLPAGERYRLKLAYLREMNKILGLVKQETIEQNRPIKIILNEKGKDAEKEEDWSS